jgi:hypothetical protein
MPGATEHGGETKLEIRGISIVKGSGLYSISSDASKLHNLGEEIKTSDL